MLRRLLKKKKYGLVRWRSKNAVQPAKGMFKNVKLIGIRTIDIICFVGNTVVKIVISVVFGEGAFRNVNLFTACGAKEQVSIGITGIACSEIKKRDCQ